MRASFTEFLHNIKCVEVGVGGGANALTMLSSVPNFKLYLVDSYDINHPTFQFGKKFTEVERIEFIDAVNKKLVSYADRIKWLMIDSVEASQKFENGSLDYVYIDAEHDYDNVIRDLKAWWPKVKKGGYMGGDDLGAQVEQAVNDFFGKGNYQALGRDWGIMK